MPFRRTKHEGGIPGEGAAFAEFYRRHERLVRSVLFSLVPPGEVDDLVQQVFLRCWSNRHAFEGRAKESTWVTRITINLAHDFFRAKKPVAAPLDEAALLADDGANRAVRRSDAGMMLQKALPALSFEHRTVVVLHYFQDLSVEEIGTALDEPVGTVKSRLHHAKAKLKLLLTDASVTV